MNKETQAIYKAMVKVSRSTAEHFKKLIAEHEELNKECRVIIEHYEHKIDNIKLPYPKAKKVLEDLQDNLEYSQAIVRNYKETMAGNKDIIKLSKNHALVYEHQLKKYKQLLFGEKTPGLVKKSVKKRDRYTKSARPQRCV